MPVLIIVSFMNVMRAEIRNDYPRDKNGPFWWDVPCLKIFFRKKALSNNKKPKSLTPELAIEEQQ